MKLQTGSAIRIPKSFENQVWYQNIRMDLNRQMEDYRNPGSMISMQYWMDIADEMWIPRYYPISQYGIELDTPILTDGEDINIQFNKQWRNDLQIQANQYLLSNNSGVIQLPPGEGKTVIMIGSICKIAKKSIIFVHKGKLLEQWIDRFQEHTNLNRDDISILSTSTYLDDLKKPIIISTVQTLNSMSKRIPSLYQDMFNANIGVSVWDECHITGGAEEFSKSAYFCPSKRTFGLSATPKRSDRNDDIIYYHLGDVKRFEGVSNTMTPKIIRLHFDHRAIAIHKRYIYFGIPEEGKPVYPRFDQSRYLQMLMSKKNPFYMQYMQRICRQIYDKGFVTLCLAERINILENASLSIPKREDVGFFLPKMKELQSSELYKRFVFSTYGSARDGTDRDEFNCLIMATPCGNLEQAIGRVCRPRLGKQQPIVFDIVDTGGTGSDSEIEGRAGYRLKYYRGKGYEVVDKFVTL